MNTATAWKWVLVLAMAGTAVVAGQPKKDELPLPKETKRGTLAPPREFPPVPGTPADARTGPLALEEVLGSVEAHYPLLAAVQREREIAGGRLLSAFGAFDTNVRVSSLNQPEGTFENYRSFATFEQAFAHSGITVFGGYRTGFGQFPIYYGDRKTADGGEFRGGVNVPLLQNREIDRRRAGLAVAEIDRKLVEPNVERSRLDFYRAASRSYWAWVASGKRVALAKSLLELASDRDEQIAARVKGGTASQIERVDNQQNIALRGTVVTQTEQVFRQASVELSLFLRDALGEPVLPKADRLPTFPELRALDVSQFDFALSVAMESRPELKRQVLQYERLSVERRLADNQTLPALNAFLAGSQDIGFSKDNSGPDRLDRRVLETGLELIVPIQRREARGRMIAIQGQMVQLMDQMKYMREMIRAEVQATWAGLEGAYATWEQANARVELAKRVAEGERELQRLGQSDILRVTLRESAAFDAELAELTAKFEYFRTLAEYRAALGIDGRERQ